MTYKEFNETHNGMLWYPSRDEPEKILVELYDVRAADDLVIWYDFDRDGYVIERGQQPDEEVAFIRSFQDLEELEQEFEVSETLMINAPRHEESPPPVPHFWSKRALIDLGLFLGVCYLIYVLIEYLSRG